MSITSPKTEPRSTADEQQIHVLGGCAVGREVARRLAGRGCTVHLHDPEPPGEVQSDFQIHTPPTLNAETLAESGLDEDAVLLAVNPADSTNLLLGQVARTRFGVERVLARVNDPHRISAFEAADIETIDCSAILADAIAERC